MNKKAGKADPKKGQKSEESVILDANVREIQSLSLFSSDGSLVLKKLNTVLLINYIKEVLLGKPIEKSKNVSISLYGRSCQFKIVEMQYDSQEGEKNTLSEGDENSIKYVVTKKTQITLLETDTSKDNDNKNNEKSMIPEESLETEQKIIIAGLDKEIDQLIGLIKRLKQDQIKTNKLLTEFLSVKGILIYGPPGVGKSSLIKFVSNQVPGVRFFIVNTREIISKYAGEAENKISEIFLEAKQQKPSVIFFDDIHIILDKKELGRENSQVLYNTFLNEIDSLTQQDKTLVIIATNQANSLDQSLRRAGRFDKEIKIEIPSSANRIKIFKKYLSKIPHNLSEDDIVDISEGTNGFTGADILSLLRESLVRSVPLTEELNEEEIKLSKKAIDEAVEEVNPSGLKDIILEIPKVLWSDIGGYEDIKKQIYEVIEMPLKHPEAFTRMAIKPSRGVLLYGPPGCSKTMIAKAIATESKLNFLAVKGPEIFSKYVGDSEKAIRDLFKRARLCAPSIIFFDEIDAIASQRSESNDVSSRVLTQLLTEMDGVESLKHVIVVAATNRPDTIDLALLRPGRFDHLTYIKLPDINCRREILKLNIIKNNMPREDDIDIEDLAKRTEGYTGAEIWMICREAGMNALSRDLMNAKVRKEDFDHSLKKILPRITKETIEYYDNFEKNTKLI